MPLQSIYSEANWLFNVTSYGKRAHFVQELIFQYKQLTFATPLDFVHNSESLNCFYNFSRENQFSMLIVHLKAQLRYAFSNTAY